MFDNTPRTFLGAATFHVDGMTCQRCKAAVTDEIGRLYGVGMITVDVGTGTVTVLANQPVDRVDIAGAGQAGYVLRP
ncbi:MAG: heavy-metal-associated domain-containing protein [Humibacillus sp.]|nr:heavy-metal-associated domain-containing protein [Humibacillus sp.]MDN5777842.1 heavy-metal-associated domain-containing protein [Humibacillus sp.]